jgi:hypothetical protein
LTTAIVISSAGGHANAMHRSYAIIQAGVERVVVVE